LKVLIKRVKSIRLIINLVYRKSTSEDTTEATCYIVSDTNNSIANFLTYTLWTSSKLICNVNNTISYSICYWNYFISNIFKCISYLIYDIQWSLSKWFKTWHCFITKVNKSICNLFSCTCKCSNCFVISEFNGWCYCIGNTFDLTYCNINNIFQVSYNIAYSSS